MRSIGTGAATSAPHACSGVRAAVRRRVGVASGTALKRCFCSSLSEL
jgi:hypothetical protein